LGYNYLKNIPCFDVLLGFFYTSRKLFFGGITLIVFGVSCDTGRFMGVEFEGFGAGGEGEL